MSRPRADCLRNRLLPPDDGRPWRGICCDLLDSERRRKQLPGHYAHGYAWSLGYVCSDADSNVHAWGLQRRQYCQREPVLLSSKVSPLPPGNTNDGSLSLGFGNLNVVVSLDSCTMSQPSMAFMVIGGGATIGTPATVTPTATALTCATGAGGTGRYPSQPQVERVSGRRRR